MLDRGGLPVGRALHLLGEVGGQAQRQGRAEPGAFLGVAVAGGGGPPAAPGADRAGPGRRPLPVPATDRQFGPQPAGDDQVPGAGQPPGRALALGPQVLTGRRQLGAAQPPVRGAALYQSGQLGHADCLSALNADGETSVSGSS